MEGLYLRGVVGRKKYCFKEEHSMEVYDIGSESSNFSPYPPVKRRIDDVPLKEAAIGVRIMYIYGGDSGVS